MSKLYRIMYLQCNFQPRFVCNKSWINFDNWHCNGTRAVLQPQSCGIILRVHSYLFIHSMVF